MHPKLIMSLKAHKLTDFATVTTSEQADLALHANDHKIDPNSPNPAADHKIVESPPSFVDSDPDYELRNLNMQEPSATPGSTITNKNRKEDEPKLAEDRILFQNIMGYLVTESKLGTQKCQEIKNVFNEIGNYPNKEDELNNNEDSSSKTSSTTKTSSSSNNENEESKLGTQKCQEIKNVFNEIGNCPNKEDELTNNEDRESCKAANSALSTSKYENSKSMALEKKPHTPPKSKIIKGLEMVPVGSGTTFIAKDDYEKINWTSYTKATRCLLRAVFPRSVLATHSMTGKPSPAFKDKQQKMCLDTRKVLDIINEVRDKFHIQENLVRGTITITCADESKMWRIRQKKQQENIAPKKSTKKA